MSDPPAAPSISSKDSFRFLRNIIVKALLLFVILNITFAFLDPLPILGRISAYNAIFPGRVRLPFGEIPEQAYNLSLFQLEAMFASHELAARPKSQEEYRVLLLGDSSVWGFLLKPDQTLSAQINAQKLVTRDGMHVRAYNLGYPTLSLTKDLVILDIARRFQPDMIIWLVTLESFPYDKQLASPIVQHNPERVRKLIRAYHLNLDPDDHEFVDLSFWERTIVGQRRSLADILRLQLYGILWASTGIDQYYPKDYEPPLKDLPDDRSFHKLNPPDLNREDLAFDVLEAGMETAGGLPVIIVNEPVYISMGKNSHIRYNFFYPRWAFDRYRQLMEGAAREKGWHYIDTWNLVPAGEFTNSAIHMTPEGTAQLADVIRTAIQKIIGE